MTTELHKCQKSTHFCFFISENTGGGKAVSFCKDQRLNPIGDVNSEQYLKILSLLGLEGHFVSF